MSIRFHEFEIRKQCPEVFVIRKTLTEMAKDARLDEVVRKHMYLLRMANVFLAFLKPINYQEKRLWVGETEVGVVYMRCGYHPDQYPTERSRSMKS